MSQHQTAQWLVVYDIAQPRRLGRVFRCLKKEGIPIQYSVFALETTPMKIGQLMARLSQLIDKNDDDVRAYRLPADGWQTSLGAAILPAGVLIQAA